MKNNKNQYKTKKIGIPQNSNIPILGVSDYALNTYFEAVSVDGAAVGNLVILP